jgi:hypothetical protein
MCSGQKDTIPQPSSRQYSDVMIGLLNGAMASMISTSGWLRLASDAQPNFGIEDKT